jgi:hypothetical protein
MFKGFDVSKPTPYYCFYTRLTNLRTGTNLYYIRIYIAVYAFGAMITAQVARVIKYDVLLYYIIILTRRPKRAKR